MNRLSLNWNENYQRIGMGNKEWFLCWARGRRKDKSKMLHWAILPVTDAATFPTYLAINELGEEQK